MTDKDSKKTGLRRELSLGLLALYGLGTTVGAGIFVLIGEIAGVSGTRMPLAFLLAAVLAGIAAFAFAEMSARFPESAGEAVYVKQGFGSASFATVIGLLVAAAGVLSTAAIMKGFAGYTARFVDLPQDLLTAIGIVGLGLVVYAGVKVSVGLAAVVTLIEVSVLLVLIGLWLSIDTDVAHVSAAVGSSATPEPVGDGAIAAIFAGALLAFYAFIGFEDIVNVAEETRDPVRTLPRAIAITLVVTTVLYVLVALAALGLMPLAELAGSSAPVAALFERHLGASAGDVVSFIALFSVLNGALIQLIMASRVLYGLSRHGWIGSGLAAVSARTGTPARAILIAGAIALVLGTLFPIDQLARITSLTTLLVFAAVNAALIRVKRRGPPPDGAFQVPMVLPIAGLVVLTGMAGYAIWDLVPG